MRSPQEVYQGIRDGRDGPIGECWEGVGVYLGEDVWGDPVAFGLAGAYDLLWRAARRPSGQVERDNGRDEPGTGHSTPRPG